MLVGLVLSVLIVARWGERGFGELSEARLAILAATLVIVGHPDLLLLVPALHPRSAPELLTVSAERASGAGDEVAALIERLARRLGRAGFPNRPWKRTRS